MNKAFVSAENCKSCGLCIHYCPKQAIDMTEHLNTQGYKYVAVDAENCIGCGICYTVCPDCVFRIAAQAE